MAIVQQSASGSSGNNRRVARLLVAAAVGAVLAIMVWAVAIEIPVEVPDLVPAGPEVVMPASHGGSAIVLPARTNSANGDGRILIQFDGLRPGVTAE